jgi:hypothetical protein
MRSSDLSRLEPNVIALIHVDCVHESSSLRAFRNAPESTWNEARRCSCVTLTPRTAAGRLTGFTACRESCTSRWSRGVAPRGPLAKFWPRLCAWRRSGKDGRGDNWASAIPMLSMRPGRVSPLGNTVKGMRMPNTSLRSASSRRWISRSSLNAVRTSGCGSWALILTRFFGSSQAGGALSSTRAISSSVRP